MNGALEGTGSLGAAGADADRGLIPPQSPVSPDSPVARAWRPRWAAPEDNRDLIALTAACPMEGEVGLRVDRSPDFFALNRLEGGEWKVAVVDSPDGGLAGCVAGAVRRVYIGGEPRKVMYVGDLKVHPRWRGTGPADVLSAFAREYCRERGGDHAITLMTVLGGNAGMARRAEGPRGLPRLERFAGIRAYNIGLLWKRKPPRIEGLSIERAFIQSRQSPADLAREMAALWSIHAPHRQFAPCHDAEGFAAWVAAAPGLSWEDHWLARDRQGNLVAFVGFWDQDAFKQMRVTRYSPGLKAFRSVFNLAAPMLGAAPLPAAGGRLRYRTAVNLCVPAGRADILRALIIAAYNDLRGRGYAFLTVGLDRKDPLNAACEGLLAQPTDIDALVSTPSGGYQGPSLEGLPLHFEIALV